MLCFLVVSQVMKEVCVNGSVELDGPGSGSPVHKPELEKVTHTNALTSRTTTGYMTEISKSAFSYSRASLSLQ